MIEKYTVTLLGRAEKEMNIATKGRDRLLEPALRARKKQYATVGDDFRAEGKVPLSKNLSLIRRKKHKENVVLQCSV
jgi:hypothetical protein